MTLERQCDLGLALTILAFVAVLLAGCAPGVEPPAAQLKPPSARLMTSPPQLPDVKPGDDLYQDNAEVSASYVREAGKLKSLQGYVRTVLKKR